MKTIFLFMSAVAISSGAIAQTAVEQASLEQPATQATATATAPQGGVMKKDGEMWCIKPLTDSVILDNDMVVYANGNYMTTDGKTFTLKDGGRIDFKGAVQSMDQRIDENAGMVVMANGSLWVWNKMDKPLQLANGNYVLPDGTLRLATGKYMPIDDKTFIDFDGNFTANAW